MKHLNWSVATVALIGWGSIASATETLTMWYHGAGNEVESKIVNQIITDFNASITRESSPPDAVCSMGRNGSPGFAEIM